MSRFAPRPRAPTRGGQCGLSHAAFIALAVAVATLSVLAMVPLPGPPGPGGGAALAPTRLGTTEAVRLPAAHRLVRPIVGYAERTIQLPGFDPLSGYLGSGTVSTQVPTLSDGPGLPFGVYYVDNSSDLVELEIGNSTVRTVAHVEPLYQLFGYGGPLAGMLDNEFFLGGGDAMFFGTTSSSGTDYSLETVNLTNGVVRIWNTTSPVDSYNQQAIDIGNDTVLVMSSNCTIVAYNLAARDRWSAGTLGTQFGSGSTCFEANNAYWFPEKEQIINVEAHGDTGDHVEQLDGQYNSRGEIQFTLARTIAVDSGLVFNWVNGLAYNATTDRIAFSAGYWVANQVYTYSIPYDGLGRLNTTHEIRYTVDNGSGSTGDLLEVQRYVYSSDYLWGESTGSGWTNDTQVLFDPWNNSLLPTNRTFQDAKCGNDCFEGLYAPSPDYAIDFNATLALNDPMYRIVYAYRGAPTPPVPVTFYETGLASGSAWSVTFNGTTQTATTSAIAFGARAGSYDYSVAPVVGYAANPSSGIVQVTTASASVTIRFSRLYIVSFTESGLPTGTNWSVTVNGSREATTGTVIAFALLNGSYAFSVGDVPGWHEVAMPYSGTVTVAGASVSEPLLAFRPFGYAVTFVESGLPAGTDWSVSLGGTSSSSTNLTILLSAANGTLPYAISDVPGWHETTLPYSGSVTVDGASVTEATLAFSRVTYEVRCNETGLPSGTNWSVTIGGAVVSSTTPSIVAAAPNGSVAYRIADVPGWHETTLSYSGTLSVAGASLTEPTLAFVESVYVVTVRESGLPAGTAWSATLASTTRTATATAVTFSLPNGSFALTIPPVSGYVVTVYPTVLNVSGGPVEGVVQFGPTGGGTSSVLAMGGLAYALVGGILVAIAFALVALLASRRSRRARAGPPNEENPSPGEAPVEGVESGPSASAEETAVVSFDDRSPIRDDR